MQSRDISCYSINKPARLNSMIAHKCEVELSIFLFVAISVLVLTSAVSYDSLCVSRLVLQVLAVLLVLWFYWFYWFSGSLVFWFSTTRVLQSAVRTVWLRGEFRHRWLLHKHRWRCLPRKVALVQTLSLPLVGILLSTASDAEISSHFTKILRGESFKDTVTVVSLVQAHKYSLWDNTSVTISYFITSS